MNQITKIAIGAFIASAIVAITTYASFAQQPAQPTMVQQLMSNDANIKAALAEQLDRANVQITALRAENEALKKTQIKQETKKPGLEKPEIKKP